MALVLFAEIVLGILWLIGKAISYYKGASLPEIEPSPNSNLVSDCGRTPSPLPENALHSEGTPSVTKGLSPLPPILCQHSVGWDVESAAYDESLNPYTLITLPRMPASLGIETLSFLSLPELFRAARTSKNFNRISTHYLNIFNNTLRFCSSFNYEFPRELGRPTWESKPLSEEQLEKRKILFRKTIQKLRPTDSNLGIYMRVGMTTGNTTLLLHTLLNNQCTDFRFEVVKALLEKGAKVNLSAYPEGYLEISPTKAANETQDKPLIDLIKTRVAATLL